MTGTPATSAVPRPLNPDLAQVARSLHDQYDSSLGASVVGTTIQDVADGFLTATTRTFVPLLVRRYAGAELRRTVLP